MSHPRVHGWDAELDVEETLRTSSEVMGAVARKLRSVAPTRTTVLLTGETGCGKGLIAKLIHQLSNRKDRPLVMLHCSAVPDTLLESELFGHERGAFTGAVRCKHGKFELADGGTLFLDEIGTVTPAAQIKLLHVLQEQTFQRVGGEVDLRTDVRLIAATNSDLEQLQREGSFRSDLYYRLNVFPIEIPPLRERREDIPALASRILRGLSELYAKDVVELHPDVLHAFRSYSWPGNVRELENILERAFILETGPRISPDSVPVEILGSSEAYAPVPIDSSRTLSSVRQTAVEYAERCYLREILARHQGRIDASARAAGITPRQLHKLLTRHGIRKEDFKSARSGRVAPESDDG